MKLTNEMQVDVVVQFSMLWGMTIGSALTNNEQYFAKKMKEYDSQDLLELTVKWSKEYLNESEIEDTVEFFNNKLNELEKEWYCEKNSLLYDEVGEEMEGF